MTESLSNRNTRFQRAGWAVLFLVALVLRGYRLTGFVLNQDEAHWLLYALHKNLLFEPLRNSHPRPEVLFPLLLSLPIAILGPNELSMRVLGALFGSLSIFPLASFIKRVTDDRATAIVAAALLAVSPLHVYYSSQGIPDVISLFFLLCALTFLVRARAAAAGTALVLAGCSAALALIGKANALYFWFCLVLVGLVLSPQGRLRWKCLLAMVGALIPLAVLTAVIKTRSPTLSFFQEPGVTTRFVLTLAGLGGEFYLFGLFFGLTVVAALAGVFMLAFRTWYGSSAAGTPRRWWVFGFPLVVLVVGPCFRVTAKDLLLLLPTVCLFAAVALTPRTRTRGLATVIVAGISLAQSLWGVPVPMPPRPSSAMARTTAVLARPADWPSREACRWLLRHTMPEDAILITAFTFTDPLLLELQGLRRVTPNAGLNWELLRDPGNRIKYVVFIEDYQVYAQPFAQYADAHFSMPRDANFAGYAIYGCQQGGRWVAYPDAFNSAAVYVQQGIALLEQRQCESAIGAFQTAVRVDPDAVATKHNLIAAYLECGRKEDAWQVATEALQKDPANPLINTDMAVLYLQMGRTEEGLEQCRKNVRLNIVPSISYGVLGQLLDRQGDLSAARDAYERSLSFDPTNQVTIRLLADLQARLRAKPSD